MGIHFLLWEMPPFVLKIPHQRRCIQVGDRGNSQLFHAFHKFNKPTVTCDLDSVLRRSLQSASEYSVPTSVVSPSATHLLEWVALSLTSGLGPTKARKLVEHFGSPDAVFAASLTELESTGIQAVSAQSIATGKSAELAREEISKAAAAGVTVLSAEDACYPVRLKEIY